MLYTDLPVTEQQKVVLGKVEVVHKIISVTHLGTNEQQTFLLPTASFRPYLLVQQKHIYCILFYILNTPNFVSSGARFREAEMHRPITFRVSAGSMIPSSHSRAVE